MTALRKALEKYLTLRRALGFKLRGPGGLLRQFVSFLEENGARHITSDLALQWAKAPTGAKTSTWAKRLGMVRLFARHLSATDPRTEIPPEGLLPRCSQRPAPFLYTDDQVVRLLRAARELPPTEGLRRWTYSTLLGLLAVTGLRVGEALALDRNTVDLSEGMLTILRTKYGKSRFVPLHLSSVRALRAYARRRDRLAHRSPAFFVSDRGTRLKEGIVRRTFKKLSCQIGLRDPTDHSGPRLHDLRHRFAVKTLLRWYRAGRDVEGLMPLLSTYLGHTSVACTYWYLSAAPELLGLAGSRLDRSWGDLS